VISLNLKFHHSLGVFAFSKSIQASSIPHFNHFFLHALEASAPSVPFFGEFGLVRSMLGKLPNFMQPKVAKEFLAMNTFGEQCLSEFNSSESSKLPCIFETMLGGKSSAKDADQATVDSVVQEALNLLVAGTVSATCTEGHSDTFLSLFFLM
jgi:hypothetical protein